MPTLADRYLTHYRTNYGTEFSGGRGSYKLVRGTYHRFAAAGQADRARNIAVAFRKSDFEYAHDTDRSCILLP